GPDHGAPEGALRSRRRGAGARLRALADAGRSEVATHVRVESVQIAACAVASALCAIVAPPVHAQPASVTIAGSLQSELGCPGDWDPSCAVTNLAYDASDEVWQGSFSLPAGAFEYKAALNGS